MLVALYVFSTLYHSVRGRRQERPAQVRPLQHLPADRRQLHAVRAGLAARRLGLVAAGRGVGPGAAGHRPGDLAGQGRARAVARHLPAHGLAGAGGGRRRCGWRSRPRASPGWRPAAPSTPAASCSTPPTTRCATATACGICSCWAAAPVISSPCCFTWPEEPPAWRHPWNPTPSFAVPRPLGALLARLPAYPGSVMLVTALNLGLADQLQGDVRQLLLDKKLRIHVRDARLTFDFTWNGEAFAALRRRRAGRPHHQRRLLRFLPAGAAPGRPRHAVLQPPAVDGGRHRARAWWSRTRWTRWRCRCSSCSAGCRAGCWSGWRPRHGAAGIGPRHPGANP